MHVIFKKKRKDFYHVIRGLPPFAKHDLRAPLIEHVLQQQAQKTKPYKLKNPQMIYQGGRYRFGDLDRFEDFAHLFFRRKDRTRCKMHITTSLKHLGAKYYPKF